MNAPPVAILKTGLFTAVGMDAPSSCAAFRSKLSNPTPSHFIDSAGEWIMAHQVPLDDSHRGLRRLARMAAAVIDEALADVPRSAWPTIGLQLCVAEPERPGRLAGLDDRLLPLIEEIIAVRFAPDSSVLPHGRVGVAIALARARERVHASADGRSLIVAVDSLIAWPTLMQYDFDDRLLRQDNSNGFMPGEGAGALLVGAPQGGPALLCAGIGFGHESAHIHSEEPLRADGLSAAIHAALAEARLPMHEFDFRITDISGEQYYFRDASLALSRTLHQPKEEFDLWHPAECTGEAGALAGAAIVALADSACRKAYSKGPNIVAHMSNDAGQRAAMLLLFKGA